MACLLLCGRCIVTSLADANTLLFDHLLTLKPVKFLEGELIHDVCTTTTTAAAAAAATITRWPQA